MASVLCPSSGWKTWCQAGEAGASGSHATSSHASWSRLRASSLYLGDKSPDLGPGVCFPALCPVVSAQGPMPFAALSWPVASSAPLSSSSGRPRPSPSAPGPPLSSVVILVNERRNWEVTSLCLILPPGCQADLRSGDHVWVSLWKYCKHDASGNQPVSPVPASPLTSPSPPRKQGP